MWSLLRGQGGRGCCPFAGSHRAPEAPQSWSPVSHPLASQNLSLRHERYNGFLFSLESPFCAGRRATQRGPAEIHVAKSFWSSLPARTDTVVSLSRHIRTGAPDHDKHLMALQLSGTPLAKRNKKCPFVLLSEVRPPSVLCCFDLKVCQFG